MHLPRVARTARHHIPLLALFGVLAVAGCSADSVLPPPSSTGPQLAAAGADGPQPTLVESDWERLPSLPEPRLGHAVVVFRDCIWSIGGQASRSAPPSADVWRYCPAVDATRWVRAPQLPRPLVHLAGAGVIGDRLYVAGGVTSQGQPSHDTYEFEPGAGWRLLGDRLPARIACGGGAVIDGKLYVYAGPPVPPPFLSCDDRRELNTFAAFDPAAPEGARWQVLPPAPVAHGAHCSYRTLAVGRNLYITNGGQCTTYTLVTLDHHYDVAQQSWQPGGFRRATWFSGGAVVGSRIYLYGGKDWSHWSSRGAEVTVLDTALASLPADELPPLPFERNETPGVDFRGDLVLVGGSSDGWNFGGNEVLRLHVQPGCDVHEPDDTIDRASPFAFDPDFNGNVFTAAVHHARVCAAQDVDYFRLVDQGQRTLRLELIPPTGTNYRLVVFDQGGLEVARSERPGSAMEWVVIPAGTFGYRVQVSSQDGSFDAARPYTLRARQ